MLHKTEMSEVSTNAEIRTTSFFTSKNRQMYRRLKKGQTSLKKNPLHQFSNQDSPNDLLFLTPNIVNTLSWPSIWLFDNDIIAAMKGNFYEISGLRGRKRFLPRNSETNSELVHFWAERLTQKFNFVTIQRYFEYNSDLYLHFSLTKFNSSNNFLEVSDLYLDCQQQQANKSSKEIWDFCSFEVIDQCRKGILVMKNFINEASADNQYKVMLVELINRRKVTSKKSLQNSQLKIQCSFELNCQLNFGHKKQHFLKTIKSEFGDIVLVATNMQIYQVQVQEIGQGYKMNLKPYKLSKSIANSKNNYFKHENQTDLCGNNLNASEEEIVDVRFMSNGLKLMILTNYSHIMVIQAHNFLFSQHILELFSAQIFNKYNLDEFEYTKLYPVNGSIAVEFNSKSQKDLLKQSHSISSENNQRFTKGILILKVQNNSLSFGKIINLQIQQKDIQFVCIRECEGLDQILVQYIQKKNPYILQAIKCRILMGQLNAISKLVTLEYNYSAIVEHKTQKLVHFHPQNVQKKYFSCQMPLASRVVYLINEKQLTCYKIFSELDSEKINMQLNRTFTTNFFQKPIKISVSPLTGHFLIVFKQFIKFFYFNYSSIKNYYTLKIKNIADAKYVRGGQKILFTLCDGKIYLIDAYSFQQKEIIEFYGESAQADMIDQKHLIVKSHKNVLSMFRSGWDESESKDEFSKLYEIKLEDGDCYAADQRQIVMFRKTAFIEVYAHQPPIIPNNLPQAERQSYASLKVIHPNLINRIQCSSFKEKEVPTKLLLAEQLGFILVSTNRGNIKQYLWPLQPPTNPNSPEVNTQQISSCKIINLFLDAKLTNLYAVNQNGTIIQLQINQYINGQEMPYVYIFSQKTRDDQMQKRQFTDRTYFIDNFTPTEMSLTQASQQNIDELQFFIDKIKDDIEQMTKNMNAKCQAEQKVIKMNATEEQKDFNIDLKKDQDIYKNQVKKVKDLIEEKQKKFQSEKSKAVEQYQKKLLALYKESDRLKSIMKTQNEKLTNQKNKFLKDFHQRLVDLTQEKQQEFKGFLNEYQKIEEKTRLTLKQNEIFEVEEEAEMQLYKTKIHQQEQQELDRADQQKERLLGENTKKEKQINNLKNRSNYFQNLILQTKVQITELGKDQDQYQNKKHYLQEQLKDKEDIIQKIERELVLYLKNTEDMKTIKNNHEFELQQYEKQVNPISQNFNQIENNVKHMNQQIMKQYTFKIQKTEKIENYHHLIEKLKEKKKKSTTKKLEINSKLNRITEKLIFLATHPFDGDAKKQLKELIEEGDKSQTLMKLDQSKQKQRRQGQKLIRYKNMIRKEIQQEEKRQEHVIKNQHEFYKYHNQNTALVREFNLLKKDQKYLQEQLNKLTEKVDIVKVSLLKTPMKRISSINLRKHNQIKPTPFQKYEGEQKSIIQRKNQETTDTKLSRNSQSLSFLKGLMKELNTAESKNEKIQVMRQRVRTFVNPEIKGKTQQIKKLLFGRGRGTSEMLKLN